MRKSKDLISNKGLISSHLNLNNLGEEIMSTWETRVRSEVDSADDLLRSVLRDALPKFLSLLAESLSEKDSRGLMQEGSDLVKEHAGERARETGFGPSQVVQELQMLRETVTSRLEKEMTLSNRDYETIQKTFDQAIQESLMEFFLVHAKLREQFMATLSHDLRNPLGVARMASELILKISQQIQDPHVRKDIMKLTSRIAANMKRADRMIQDLLDASVLRIGEKLPIHISECDLLAIACDVVTEFDEQEKARIQITGSSTSGYWDCEGLKRSLENLIKNAIKYGAAGTPITVQITRTNQESIRVSVHNHGNPIPQEDQKLIFRTFGKSKSTQRGVLQGWGIGLSLVRAVSESLGGSTSVESSKETGTTFTIDLPMDSRGFQAPHDRMH
jgi:signal transduction histidine kinase